MPRQSTHFWTSKSRIVLFHTAMRHFAVTLRDVGRPLIYQRLDAPDAVVDLGTALQATIASVRPERLVMTAPGDWRVLQRLRAMARDEGLELELCDDRHFFVTVREFAAHASVRKTLRLEYFYRELRKRRDIFMDGVQPICGQWNFGTDNRGAFDNDGPRDVPEPACFKPDALTREVFDLVGSRFANHPGSLDSFVWPVTRDQALETLTHFVRERLPQFGRYQDAMWPGQPWLYHSHLPAALNLKLLDPREVVAAAIDAYEKGDAPLSSVEASCVRFSAGENTFAAFTGPACPSISNRTHLKRASICPRSTGLVSPTSTASPTRSARPSSSAMPITSSV
ncbi:MAG TPA: cryptochrome/photolyase family protein [Dokdonella sp.]|uniref:cryptochrome/photolyase family protein n=1 Tax=Dokdonella sp. TaxID=2291710 RepID=UPI002D7E8CDC|nr:cryptochrome/photolyase family protein [Dokdonella sp.]HET9034075.1 cryptochrome/photolyase family protein [Dokdonella sp.]